jgi:hypothetical protein
MSKGRSISALSDFYLAEVSKLMQLEEEPKFTLELTDSSTISPRRIEHPNLKIIFDDVATFSS